MFNKARTYTRIAMLIAGVLGGTPLLHGLLSHHRFCGRSHPQSRRISRRYATIALATRRIHRAMRGCRHSPYPAHKRSLLMNLAFAERASTG